MHFVHARLSLSARSSAALHWQKRAFMPSGAVGLAGLAALLWLGASAGCAAWRLKKAVRLCAGSRVFEAKPLVATARILIVGDSTAVGTGATSPAASIAGLIARRHPQVVIVNRARNGARFADVIGQLKPPVTERFDMILILGGGNDVIHMTSAKELEAQLEKSLRLARSQADSVILMPAGNVGNCPFFFAPFSWLMTRQSRRLHQIARRATAANGAIYVNGYKEKEYDPFVLQADRLNARDGLHPSDDGYQLWFEALQVQAELSRRLIASQRLTQEGARLQAMPTGQYPPVALAA